MEIPAGRELDAKIHEQVFEGIVYWKPEEVPEGWPVYEQPFPVYPNGTGCYQLPFYSYAISHAWEVVEHMASRGFPWFTLTRRMTNRAFSVFMAGKGIVGGDPGQWDADFSDGNHYHGEADTAPLAICRAALNVKALKEKEGEKVE